MRLPKVLVLALLGLSTQAQGFEAFKRTDSIRQLVDKLNTNFVQAAAGLDSRVPYQGAVTNVDLGGHTLSNAVVRLQSITNFCYDGPVNSPGSEGFIEVFRFPPAAGVSKRGFRAVGNWNTVAQLLLVSGVPAGSATGMVWVSGLAYGCSSNHWTNRLTLAGLTMTGDVNMQSNRVLNADIPGYLTAETDPAWTAASGSVVYATTPGYTAAVEQAATAFGWGDHAAADYLPLSGHNGPVVLGTRTRGYAASTNLGNFGFAAGYSTSAGSYGFAAGSGTSAGNAGFAAGSGTSAGNAGFAAGAGTSAGYAGFAAGRWTSAGYAGFAAGESTSAGNHGFAAGRAAKGADGSFVFADNSTGGTPFNRTNRPNEFSARAAGGVYFDTPMMVVTGTVSAGSITLGTNAPITNWPEGGTGISAAEAGQIATNVAADYLPLSGYDGLAVLGTRTRGYAASTNLGDYGFAAGFGTSAGDAGFAAGESTSAGDYGFAAGAGSSASNYGFAAGYNTSADFAGFAAGEETSAGEFGFAAGEGASAGYAGFAAGSGTTAGPLGFAAGDSTSAGYAGFAAGSGTSAGDYGFAAGRAAKGADGSFVFADNSTDGMPFTRTNRPNEFAARAAGGVYFDTPMMVVTGTVSAGSITLGGKPEEDGKLQLWDVANEDYMPFWYNDGRIVFGTNVTLIDEVFSSVSAPPVFFGGLYRSSMFSSIPIRGPVDHQNTAITNVSEVSTKALTVNGVTVTNLLGTNAFVATGCASGNSKAYAWSSAGIHLQAGTNAFSQHITSIDDDTQIVLPARTSDFENIHLVIPATGGHTIEWVCTSAPIHGHVPSCSETNASVVLVYGDVTGGWRLRRFR